MTTSTLRGIIPPMVTPLKSADTLDVAGLERLIEHMIDGGVHGVFALGTTGEGPLLTYRLRQEMVERTVQCVAGRVPVLVGITDSCVGEAVAFAGKVADAGADAVVIAPPFYVPPSQSELVRFIARIVPQLPLPVYLYNMPSLTKVAYAPDTVRTAIDLPGVVGIKDSSGDMEYFQHILALRSQRPEWSFLIGPEHLLAESVLLGGDGCVGAMANIAPRLFVEIFKAADTGDLAQMRSLQERLIRLSDIYRVGGQNWGGGSAVIKGIKAALNRMHICDDTPTDPFEKYPEPQQKKIQQILDALGVATAQEILE